MASVAILVNGMPGSGKTTLATALGPILDCPVLSKDAVKEFLGDLIGPGADSRRVGGLAMDTLWRLAAETPGGVVVDANLDARTGGREFALRGVEAAGSPRIVEVFCAVPDAVARARFAEREPARHPVHHGWDPASEGMAPLGIWPVVTVDTTGPVDLDELVIDLGRQFL